MGYAFYELPDGRRAGYAVEATCDREGSDEKIDRGLGYLCGRNPDGWRDEEEYGCGFYFCSDHDADHDCPNPHDLQRHDFVPHPDGLDECQSVDGLMEFRGETVTVICGVPADRHESLSGVS